MADRAQMYWEWFLKGWKKRAYAWPLNTINATLRAGCHRSHPHEDMNAECVRLTELARATNDAAHVSDEEQSRG